MPKKPGNWFYHLFLSLVNRETTASLWCLALPLSQRFVLKAQGFRSSLGKNVFHALGSVIISHIFCSAEPSPPSSKLVGGTGGITSPLWKKLCTKVSWNLAMHSSFSTAGFISPSVEIKCLNLFVFPSLSVLQCALG